MADEVINLLSSSQPSSVPDVTTKSNNASTIQEPLQDHAPPPRSAPSNVIDLSDDTTIHPAPPLSKGTAKRTLDVSSAQNEVILYSDDFDTSLDLSFSVSDADYRTAKRQRSITGQSSALGKPSPAAISDGITGATQQPAARRLKASALDPIEFTSSPDPVPARDKGKGRATTLYVDDNDDDPFASSPWILNTKENINPLDTWASGTAASLPLDFQDPFASSSPPRPSKPPPQNRACCRSPKQSTAWDPISSSLPEVLFRAGESVPSLPVPRAANRSTLVKAQSEVINLSDSDGASIAFLASDDSLPDVADIAAKVKANLDAKYPSLNRGARASARRASQSPPRNRPVAAKSKSGVATAASSVTLGNGVSAAEMAVEKQEKAAARRAESERKRLEVEAARVEKKQEKERAKALAEVNKVRTDKKQSTPEMIVDLPRGLIATIKLQIETLLRDLQVDCTTYSSPVKNVVRWRRKVTAVYNDAAEQWEPIPLRLVKEEHVMVLMPAAEFVELARGDANTGAGAGAGDPDPGQDTGNDYVATPTLEDHVGRVQTHLPNSKLIYLIEGMGKWMRSNRAIQNRQFAAGVRSLATPVPPPPESSQAGPQRPRKQAKQKKTPVYVEEDIIEDALMRLQVMHGALIYHVDTEVEMAQWVSVFTQHISTIPYRRSRDATNDRAAFCMDTGQVRTGDDAADAYVRMLQQLTRVTPAIAYGIAAEHPTVSQLVGDFESRGALMLESCRKSTNKDGAFSDRTVGQALSRRLYKVFTGRDEGSTDV